MTHAKHEIAVFIENEEMLREARELLEKYGEEIDDDLFDLNNGKYLQYSYLDNDWFVSDLWNLTQITLPQLEEILKTEKG